MIVGDGVGVKVGVGVGVVHPANRSRAPETANTFKVVVVLNWDPILLIKDYWLNLKITYLDRLLAGPKKTKTTAIKRIDIEMKKSM